MRHRERLAGRIYPEDGVEIGLCISGQRAVAEAHGLDFKRFVRDGLPFEEVEGIDDHNMTRTIARARMKRDG